MFDTLTYRERYEDLLARTGSDALTGALDRHSLESYGRRAVEQAAAAGRPLALLLIDIDHFKAFNDRFGHAAGDRKLKQIVAGDHDGGAGERLHLSLRRRGVRRHRRRHRRGRAR